MFDPVDAFGGDGEAKTPTKPRQCADDAGTFRVDCHRLNEAAVNLDLVEFEVAQVIKARIAGAEIVEREPYAAGAQCAQGSACILGIADERTFCDLKFQPFRREPGIAQQSCDPRGQEIIAELPWIDVR